MPDGVNFVGSDPGEDVREVQDDFEPAALEGTSTTRRPDAVSLDYLTAFSLGPVALQDPSEGVFNYAWRMRVDNGAGEVYLARENDAGDGWDAETLRFSFDPADPILEADLAWNQNADPVIVAERATGAGGDPELWLHWFDPQAAGGAGDTVFNSFGEGRTPRVLLDNPRDPPTSDVLIFYFNDTTGDLVYRKQGDRYDTEYLTGLGAAADRFVEEVMKRRDSRLEVAYSEHDVADGTYSLARIVSALYPYAMETEGVRPSQHPLTGAVARVVLQVIGEFEDPDDYSSIAGYTETEGVRPAQEPLSGAVRSIVDWVLAETDDPADFEGDLQGFTGVEGVGAAQDPLSGLVEQVILLAIADTEDPDDFALVNAYTETEGVRPAQDPQSGTVNRIIIRAYNQPIEGVRPAQEPMSGAVRAAVPVTSGLTLHGDASQLNLNDLDPVSLWPDESGNGLDLEQTTASKQPVYHENVLNGLPAVRFDGDDDWLVRSGVLGSDLVATDECYIFLVMLEQAADQSAGAFRWWPGSATETLNAHLAWSDDNLYWDFGDFQNGGRVSGAQPAGWEGAWHLVELRRAPSGTQEIIVDGAIVVSGTGTTSLDVSLSGDLHLGAARANADPPYPHDGDIAEFLTYNRDLTSTEAADVRSYLQNKWGI